VIVGLLGGGGRGSLDDGAGHGALQTKRQRNGLGTLSDLYNTMGRGVN
jgi:hypothetical protein